MKNIVITGASRGIGLSLITLYQQQGCQVYGVCRQATSELKALGVNIIDDIDVAAYPPSPKPPRDLAGVPLLPPRIRNFPNAVARLLYRAIILTVEICSLSSANCLPYFCSVIIGG